MTPTDDLRMYLAVEAARTARRLGSDTFIASRRAASLYDVEPAAVIARIRRADAACDAARQTNRQPTIKLKEFES